MPFGVSVNGTDSKSLVARVPGSAGAGGDVGICERYVDGAALKGAEVIVGFGGTVPTGSETPDSIGRTGLVDCLKYSFARRSRIDGSGNP